MRRAWHLLLNLRDARAYVGRKLRNDTDTRGSQHGRKVRLFALRSGRGLRSAYPELSQTSNDRCKPVADLANLTELFATSESPAFGEKDKPRISRAKSRGEISAHACNMFGGIAVCEGFQSVSAKCLTLVSSGKIEHCDFS
jgi:hypothetical protein